MQMVGIDKKGTLTPEIDGKIGIGGGGGSEE